MVDGPFNINSTSVRAWQAFLSSLNESQPLYRDIRKPGASVRTTSGKVPFVVSRFDIAGGGCADSDEGDPSEIAEELYWRGYRSLTEYQIETLAEKIVEASQKARSVPLA